MEENTPCPFYVGQKVITVKSRLDGHFKEGQPFIVLGTRRFCCTWGIDIGIPFNGRIKCDCGKLYNSNGKAYYSSIYFAPIEEPRKRIEYVAVTEELREKAKEMAIDTIIAN